MIQTYNVQHGDVAIGIDDGIWWSWDRKYVRVRCRDCYWDHHVQRIHLNGVCLKQHCILSDLQPNKLTSQHTTKPFAHVNVKSFPSHVSPWGAAALHFCNPQPDNSLRCETMGMGLVHHVVCMFTP